MRKISTLCLLILAVLATVITTSCSKSNDEKDLPQLTPSQILASTIWETTSARDAAGKTVPLTDANVLNFVGFAYFNIDGTFRMFNLDDTPKMQGDWTVSADGKTRTIVAKNNEGTVLFTRVVDITVLTKKDFSGPEINFWYKLSAVLSIERLMYAGGFE